MHKKISLHRRIMRRAKLILSQIYFSFIPGKVTCNVCQYSSNRLDSDNWHLYSLCPKCNSEIRLRLLVAALDLLPEFHRDHILKDKKVLHFAPERASGRLFSSYAKEYRSADSMAEGYTYKGLDFNIDISDMKSIPDNSFDCVIACDVLEHVPDYRKAMKEIHRVLVPGGWSILTVPQKDHLKITLEDKSVTDPEERTRLYGQFDHLRIFGDDFASLFQEAGFEVTAVDESFFSKDTVNKYVLFPPVLSTHPLATNYRKVFFGKKK